MFHPPGLFLLSGKPCPPSVQVFPLETSTDTQFAFVQKQPDLCWAVPAGKWDPARGLDFPDPQGSRWQEATAFL